MFTCHECLDTYVDKKTGDAEERTCYNCMILDVDQEEYDGKD